METENGTIALDDERRRLADRLRVTREFLGLSQQDAASAANMSRVALSAIETGKRRVESVELQALARVYRQPIDFFLSTGVEEPNSPELRFLARAAQELSTDDRHELLKFAEFLKTYRAPKPTND